MASNTVDRVPSRWILPGGTFASFFVYAVGHEWLIARSRPGPLRLGPIAAWTGMCSVAVFAVTTLLIRHVETPQ